MTAPIILDEIPFDLDGAALKTRLSLYEDDAEEFDELLARCRELARPKAVYKTCYIEDRGEETVTLAGITFTSRALRANLADVEKVFPHVATCGNELEELEAGLDPFARFWADTVKAELLHCARRFLDAYIDRVHGLPKAARMSPGSGDASIWPIQEQRPLFDLLGEVEGMVGVRLTETFLMLPNKSVSGIRYPAAVDFRSCQLCHRADCPGRAAEFDAELYARMGLDEHP